MTNLFDNGSRNEAPFEVAPGQESAGAGVNGLGVASRHSSKYITPAIQKVIDDTFARLKVLAAGGEVKAELFAASTASEPPVDSPYSYESMMGEKVR